MKLTMKKLEAWRVSMCIANPVSRGAYRTVELSPEDQGANWIERRSCFRTDLVQSRCERALPKFEKL